MESFDVYVISVNSQLDKDRPDGVIYDLYKSGTSVLDAVTILEGKTIKTEKKDEKSN
jgi:hypothetical protein